MEPQRVFMTAEWVNLVMMNYSVDPGLLEPLVPHGTILDHFDGKVYVSLIGFEFNRSRIYGVPIPFHQSFEEVNLRFYVRRGEKRGAAFIKELVPKRAVAAIARFAFNENYSYVPMAHRVERGALGEIQAAEFAWGREPKRSSMRIQTEGEGFLAPEGSLSQFITEHYWGYAAQADGGCLEYEVEHPRWTVWDAKDAQFAGDGAWTYDAEFAAVLAREPDSAFMAEGSPVAVSKGMRID
jgi:uncharacterized protein YqjF (DUF2071 family)